MKLKFDPEAIRDLREIAAYLVPRSPTGARHVRDEIVSTVKLISRFPYAGRSQDEPDTRKRVTSRYRYVIVYRIDADQAVVQIVKIYHPVESRSQSDA